MPIGSAKPTGFASVISLVRLHGKMAQPLGRSKMKSLFGATLVAVLATCVAVPFVALGQQKTAKECRDEWRASTDAAKGTQKDYVAKCRGEGAAAPAARPAAGGAKTAKECRDEWRASTDANKGTQKDYVAKCRGEGTAATFGDVILLRALVGIQIGRAHV